jgi:hypothetical protein
MNMSYNQTKAARDIARQLSYDGGFAESRAKFLLLELASTIDAMTITAHKKRDGLLLINGYQRSRYATLKERIAYKIFGLLPQKI